MITQEERIIRKSQGYDISFEKNGKKYWINSNTWNKEKEEKLFQETGLRAFREEAVDKNLVIYDPEYFEITSIGYLHYIGSIEKDIPQPINMSNAFSMFEDCNEVQSLDLLSWDMSSVKDMGWMFEGCSSLQSLNIYNWDVSSVENTSSMFCYCTSLQSLNLAGWDVSNINNMEMMFLSCSSLQFLNLTNWDTKNLEYAANIFYDCSSLYSKYNTIDGRKLLERIIEDSNKKQQANKVDLF